MLVDGPVPGLSSPPAPGSLGFTVEQWRVHLLSTMSRWPEKRLALPPAERQAMWRLRAECGNGNRRARLATLATG